MVPSPGAYGNNWRDALNRRSWLKYSPAVPAAILLTGLVAGVSLYIWLDRIRAASEKASLSADIVQLENWIYSKLDSYEDALRGASAYLSVVPEINRPVWHAYTDRLQALDHYPSDSTMFFAEQVDDADLASFVRHQQSVSFPNFHVHGPGDARRGLQPQHWIVTAVEPLGPNPDAFGIDHGVEPHRRAAIIAARDEGLPGLTPPVTITRSGKNIPGLMLYVPVYRAGAKVGTVEERRAAFRGMVGTTFSTDEFFDQASAVSDAGIAMTVYYGAVGRDNFVYRSFGRSAGRSSGVPRENPEFESVSTLSLAGTVWTVGWNRGSDLPP